MRPKGDAAELEARRREAMRLLDEGVTPADVAARVGCHVKSVHRWNGLRSRGGHAALRARPNTGRPPRLTERQRARLTTLLLDGALANGFATDLWTCPRIVSREPCFLGHFKLTLNCIGEPLALSLLDEPDAPVVLYD